jgi:hypothetical protein
MEHFSTEPERLSTIKWLLLIVGSLGFIIFLFEYLMAWLYPIAGSTFNRLILFHIFHLMLIIATCIVRGGIIRVQWFSIYISSYILAFIMDAIGCIWRTLILTTSADTLSITNHTVGVIMIAIEWILPVICVVQIIIAVATARMTSLYLYAQDLIIGVLMRNNGSPEAEMLIERAVKKLRFEFGFTWKRVKDGNAKQN